MEEDTKHIKSDPQANESLAEGKNDNSVKLALKKEQQPIKKSDLSSLENNTQIGTSGGDQRASESELKDDNMQRKNKPPEDNKE